jgi:type I restriction enzyme S subunit
MSIAKGYKQTEVGVIPEDWEIKSVDEVFDFYSTANYSKAQMQLDNEVGCLHYGLIHAIPNSYYDLRNGIKYFITQNQAKYEYLKDGDVVMVDASEDLTGVNKSVEVHGIDGKKYISGLHTFLLRDKGYYTSYIRGAILNSEIVKNQMLRLAVGMKVFGVSKPQLKTVLIPIPPLPEQTAIANALSDMDALIAQTEKLIEKKKAIKQGVMQELLKPKEGWVTKKLGEVAVFRRGSFPQPYGLDKWYDDINGKPFVQVFDVDDNKKLKEETKRYISVDAQKMSVFAKKGTIVLTIQGSIGRIAIIQYDAYIDRTLLIFESYKYEFNDYFFMHTIHQLFEIEKQSAPGGIIKTITKDTLKNFEISFPEIDEQSRIGLVIKDIESDIETMETKLQKLKLQKQGMMQALLTGKIRLL